MNYIYKYNTKIGNIWISSDEVAITNLYFKKPIGTFFVVEKEIIKDAYIQIKDYLEGKKTTFDIKLNPRGTSFQISVWKYLKEIPYGETKTYKDIAIALGDYKKARAVGMANHNNPIPIIIPCHRVIGSNGDLIGYAGGLELKKYLLSLEHNKKDYKKL